MPLLHKESQRLDHYEAVRQFSLQLCHPLTVEDQVVQSMPDASPIKWHLAHTTWFFEQVILVEHVERYHPFHPQYFYLFNSYYNAFGHRHARAQRGLLSRPTVEDIRKYRQHVDQAIGEWLSRQDSPGKDLADLMEWGIHHEQQHQELMLTDVKHAFSQNPLHPIYVLGQLKANASNPFWDWLAFPEGVYEIGHHANANGFAYDNERPQHKVFLNAFRAANQLVTNAEFLEFIEDDGYQRPEFWLSDGWDAVQKEGWRAPLYWEKQHEHWYQFTLNGFRKLDLQEPVCHVSFFEADAYARWAEKRLLTEAEWEVVARDHPVSGHLMENSHFHPRALDAVSQQSWQFFGDVWEWTSSPYVGYPGYRPSEGALGEYNGKFMCNQMVLRGGSCATPATHIRHTYRNFFSPYARWQFSGIRLGEDL